MHDISELERQGIPGVFVASEVFAESAQAQGHAIGFQPARHFVPHPIQDRSDAEMAAIADAAIDALVQALVA